MSVYLIIEIKALNPALYSQYVAKVADVVLKHGGRYLVRGGKGTTFAGDWKPERMILIEFESMERARAWWDSPEYAPAKAIRQSCADTQLVITEGVPA